MSSRRHSEADDLSYSEVNHPSWTSKGPGSEKQESAPKGAFCRGSEPTLKSPRALPTKPTRRKASVRPRGSGVKDPSKAKMP